MFAGSGFGKVHENEIPYLCNIYRKKGRDCQQWKNIGETGKYK